MSSVTTQQSQADEALLRRFVAAREADAFAELARRHAALVYGTCLRVTGDRHDAEELTQESFFRLARRAGTIRTSVAGWLHATAVRLSLNAVRARGRRRAHEAAAGRETADAAPEPSPWREIEPILDAAVDALPGELREAIVLHFLRSLPQAEVAARLGVHQSTVSRRVAEGLRRLHDRLTAAGVSLAAVPLADVLVAAADPAGVPDLSGTLGRAALTGAAGGALGGAGAVWAKAKGVAFVASASLPIAFVEFVAGVGPGIVAGAAWLAFFAWLRPRWIDDVVMTSDGRSVYDNPYYPFQRWDWEKLPADWRKAMAGSLGITASWWAGAWALSRPRPGGGGLPIVGVFVVYGLFLGFVSFLRIAWKAATLPTTATAEPRPVAPVDGPAMAQAIGVALVLPLFASCMALTLSRQDERPAVLAVFMVPLVAGVVGCWVDAVSRWRRFQRDRAAATASGPDRAGGTRARRLLLAVLLGFAALQSLGPLNAEMIRRGNPQYAASTQGARFLEGGEGMQPALALLVLALTIQPLMLARSSMSRRTWLVVVALAVFLAMVNAAFCAGYIWKSLIQ